MTLNETSCLLIEYSNIFEGKSCKNVHQKLVPDLFLVLVNNSKQPLHARNYFKNKIVGIRIIKKLLKS